MSKYTVETFYTCTFKMVHKLDELNEKNLSELENRKDGKFEIIDVKLNNRKTKTTNDKGVDIPDNKSPKKENTDIYMESNGSIMSLTIIRNCMNKTLL